MTLVIAGYMFKNAFSFSPTDEAEDKLDPEPCGIFFAADSAITDPNGQTLLNGFKKIYSVPVRLLQPTFVAEYFQGYAQEYRATNVGVAFAGSTLTAQHFLNSVTNHLANLHITFDAQVSPITYRVGLNCETNPIEGQPGPWAEDTFTPSDYVGLLTAEVISSAVHHALHHAMRSARKYKLNEAGIKSLLTPFILGVQCPTSGSYHLYQYDMRLVLSGGVLEPEVHQREVPHSDVAVIGMHNEFGAEAQAVASATNQAGVSAEYEVFRFLNESITKVRARDEKGIDRPSLLKALQGETLHELKRER